MRVKVLAIEALESGVPLEAVLIDAANPDRGLMLWWGNYGWETLAKTVTVDSLFIEKPHLRRFEFNLPNDWPEGYLQATGGKVSFVYGRAPNRT
jgi:hypothetical protein